MSKRSQRGTAPGSAISSAASASSSLSSSAASYVPNSFVPNSIEMDESQDGNQRDGDGEQPRAASKRGSQLNRKRPRNDEDDADGSDDDFADGGADGSDGDDDDAEDGVSEAGSPVAGVKQAPGSSKKKSAARPKKSRRKNDTYESAFVDDDDDGSGSLDLAQIKADNKFDAGVIEFMRVENFMCHDALEVKFSNNVNVITGPNGSGKSAILTGLQIALGAKAGSTNRGSSLRDMVKTGKETATITVQLRNRGLDAFKPEVYGKSIILERRIDRSTGGGGYKIKNSQGKTVSTKFQEVKALLQQFNIQIDNPTTVMTQDVSRKFLPESTGKDKYAFFMRATQLQDIVDNLAIMKQNRDQAAAILGQKQESLEESKQILDSKRKEYEEALRMEQMEQRLAQLSGEQAWAAVIAHEKIRDEQLEKKEKEQKQLEELKKKKADDDRASVALEAEHNQLSQQLQLTLAEMTSLRNEQAAKQEKLRELTGKQQTYVVQANNIKKRMQQSEASLQHLQRQEKEMLQQTKISYEREISDLQARIEEKEQQKADLKKKLDEAAQAQQDSEKRNMVAREQVSRLEAEMNTYKARESAVSLDIRRLEESKNDRLILINKNIPAILNAISKNASKFSRLPIGPIGHFITVRPDIMGKFGAAIEASLKNFINGFIVASIDDQKVLSQILRQQQASNMTILVQPFTNKRYDVRKDHNYTTMLESLVLDRETIGILPLKYPDMQTVEATIMNMITDQHEAERIVLVEGRQNAQALINDKGCPSSIKEAIDEKHNRAFKRGAAKIALGGNAQSIRFFGGSSNTHEKISSLGREIAELREKQQGIEAEIRQHKQSANQMKTETVALQQNTRKYHLELQKVQREIDDLHQDINTKRREEKESDTSTQVRAVQERIKDKEQEMESYQARLAELEKSAADMQPEIDEAKAQVQAVANDELSKKSMLTDQLQEKLRISISKMSASELRRRSLNDSISKVEGALFSINSRVVNVEGQIREAMATAVEMHPQRINTNRTEDEVRREIQQTNQQIAFEQKRFKGRSVAEVKRDFEIAAKKFQQMEKAFNIATDANEKISDSLDNRFKKGLIHLRDEACNAVSTHFNKCLMLRGHSGNIVFDHGNKSLELIVNMDPNQQESQRTEDGAAVRGVKTLSGGEKSFSTCCLLLALWQVVESPFRALDEIDIFMDSVYRKTTYGLLIKTALESQSRRQLIVLTPQETSFVQVEDKRVRLHKLSPPARAGYQTSVHSFAAQ